MGMEDLIRGEDGDEGLLTACLLCAEALARPVFRSIGSSLRSVCGVSYGCESCGSQGQTVFEESKLRSAKKLGVDDYARRIGASIRALHREAADEDSGHLKIDLNQL